MHLSTYMSLLILSIAASIHAGFTEDTLVTTPEGHTPIAHLHEHDRLISLAPRGTTTNQKIRSHVRQDTYYLVKCYIDDEILISDRNQRFYIPHEAQWYRARDLVPGQHVLKSDGSTTAINHVELLHTDEPTSIYEIIVDTTHTYLVTRSGILVHNTGIEVTLLSITWGATAEVSWVPGLNVAALSTAVVITAGAYAAQKICKQHDIEFNEDPKVIVGDEAAGNGKTPVYVADNIDEEDATYSPQAIPESQSMTADTLGMCNTANLQQVPQIPAPQQQGTSCVFIMKILYL